MLKTKGISIPPDRRPQTSTALPMCIHMCPSYEVKTAPPSVWLHSHNSSLNVLWISWSDDKVHFLYSSVSVLINFHVYRFFQFFQLVCPFCLYFFFFSDTSIDESGCWLTLHKKCTVNSCWDLGRQRYAWPSKDDILTVPLCIHVMPSSVSRPGHLTSETSIKICVFISEGMMLSDKKGQVAKELRKLRARCNCSR